MNIKHNLSLTFLIAALAAVPLAVPAQSMGEEGDTTAPPFEEIDQNLDGRISAEEAQDTWLADVFQNFDSNGDGFIDRTEYENVG